MGVFVAGQCLLPLTLFMIAPVRPHAHFLGGGGGEKEKKNKIEGKKWQEKVNCYWQIPTHFLGDSRWNHGTVNTSAQNQPCWGVIPTATPKTQGLVHLSTVWDAHQQKWFKESWTQRAGRKSLRWLVLWFVAVIKSIWWVSVVSKGAESMVSREKREGQSALAGAQ